MEKILYLNPIKHILFGKLLEELGYTKIIDERSTTKYEKESNSVLLNREQGYITLKVDKLNEDILRAKLNKDEHVFEFDYYLGGDECGRDSPSQPYIVFVVLCSKSQIIDLFLLGVMDSKDKNIKNLNELNNKILENVTDYTFVINPPETIESLKSRSNEKEILADMYKSEIIKVMERNDIKSNLRITIDKFDEINSNRLDNYLKKRFEKAKILNKPNGERECISVAASSILAKHLSITEYERSKRRFESKSILDHVRFLNLSEEYYEDTRKLLEELDKFYPGVLEWFDDKIVKNKDPTSRGRLVVLGNEVIAVLLSKWSKNEAKIRNLFVKAKYQNRGLGDALLQEEVNYLISKNIKKITVTLAEENSYLIGFFNKYGFIFVGYQPNKYRSGSTELIFLKECIYEYINKDNYKEFCIRQLFQNKFYNSTQIWEDTYLLQPKVSTLPVSEALDAIRYSLKLIDENLSIEELEDFIDLSQRYESKPIICCINSEKIRRYKNILIIDLFDIRKLFFPIEYVEKENSAIIIPIRDTYASSLFLNTRQSTFNFNKINYRKENVYYRSKSMYDKFLRGKTIFFYNTDNKKIEGKAIIVDKRKDMKKSLIRVFGPLGCWTLTQLDYHLKDEEAMAIKFDFFQPCPKNVTLKDLKRIVPNLNPVTAFKINEDQHIEINKRGGYFGETILN